MTVSKEEYSKNIVEWQKKNTDSILVRYRKGTLKPLIEDHLAYTGESMAKFIERAVRETIERDRQGIAARNKAERKARQE